MYVLLSNLFGNLGDQSISVLILFIQNAKQPYVFFQSPGEKKNRQNWNLNKTLVHNTEKIIIIIHNTRLTSTKR